MDITLEPTLAPNEFKVVEWDSVFEIAMQPPLTIEQAKEIILSYSEKRAWMEYLRSIRHKRQTIS